MMAREQMPTWLRMAVIKAGYDPADVAGWRLGEMEVGQIEPVKVDIRLRERAAPVSIDFEITRGDNDE